MCSDPVVHGASFADDAVMAHIHLDPVPASVSIGRRYVTEQADAWMSDDEVHTLILLTSELVTNAILHARTSSQLGFVRDDRRLLVAVADRAPAAGGLEAMSWSSERPGGRGLALVDELSEEWGAVGLAHGKSVWFVLPLEGRHRTAAAGAASGRRPA